MPMKRKLLYSFLGCVLIYFVAHHFYSSRHKPEMTIEVATSAVAQRNVISNIQTIGTVQAYSSIDIKSMVTGPLLSTGFKEGEMVTQNQKLFVIDPRPFEAALDEAKANLLRDQATLSNNALQVKRNTPLVKKGFIARQDFDTLETNVKAMAATVKADEVAVENAQLQLSYATIEAPISGRTGSIMLKPGSLVKANDTNALVTINQVSPIYITFSIPQNKLPAILDNLQSNMKDVTATINAREAEVGQITFVNNSIDTTTGTVELKATFLNKQLHFWPGQYVTIDLPVDHLQSALLVPSLALLAGQQGFYVYVLDADSVAHVRQVTPGPAIGHETVIEKGLQAGDKVVISGQLKLQDGMKVNVKS